jgi:hypothetical protein
LLGRLDAERTASQRLNWSALGLISTSYTTCNVSKIAPFFVSRI